MVLTAGPDDEHGLEVHALAEVSEVVYDVKAGTVRIVKRRKG